MADDLLSVAVDDGVAVVTLQRPEARNALNADLLAALPETMRQLDADPSVAAIVLTGADPAFCAGLDLDALASDAGMQANVVANDPRSGPVPLLDTPVIGAVNGPAVTGGLELALACDFLVASDRARFADTHARVGVMPGWGMTVALPAAVGVRRARQMSFTGNYVDAPTALAWGLVNVVVPHDDLLPTARGLAADIASNQPEAVREIKAMYAATQAAATEAEARRAESERSTAWMARFDPRELAARVEAIRARGRRQVSG